MVRDLEASHLLINMMCLFLNWRRSSWYCKQWRVGLFSFIKITKLSTSNLVWSKTRKESIFLYYNEIEYKKLSFNNIVRIALVSGKGYWEISVRNEAALLKLCAVKAAIRWRTPLFFGVRCPDDKTRYSSMYPPKALTNQSVLTDVWFICLPASHKTASVIVQPMTVYCGCAELCF